MTAIRCVRLLPRGWGGLYTVRGQGRLVHTQETEVRSGLSVMEGKVRLAAPAWATLGSASLQGWASPPLPVASVLGGQGIMELMEAVWENPAEPSVFQI